MNCLYENSKKKVRSTFFNVILGTNPEKSQYMAIKVIGLHSVGVTTDFLYVFELINWL